MILLPAIDLHQGQCVRLLRGDYDTAQVVAADPVETARAFEEQGAGWLHVVDLDGAKEGAPKNAELIAQVVERTGLQVEVGGGIRNMATVDRYLELGAARVILGSAALRDPQFVAEAVKRYGKRVAVGIDALGGKVAAEGWLEQSQVDYLELARRMEALGVQYLICTDISQDGTLAGPNLTMLDQLNQAVSCHVVASGGVSSLLDIVNLYDLGLYGAIAGKALYTGALDLRAAIAACRRIGGEKGAGLSEDELDLYFRKSDLIPAIIQDDDTGEVLMLAYMNRESFRKSLETGTTWFYSRSRRALWNKGETSGHTQTIVGVWADCDDDTLLLRVKQKGAACHTGSHSCFYKKLRG
ncbi:MAG TPA: 1-(5-phosphoribosyl)-5-[(5-phosphoribosylamino)methylideneamino]imidazole-4-carboxamide isomerase [Candidatus Acutalibacter pullistercoris]|uniref:Multifunctional fusion protein n=1 Tax=Candidatus Acutalibacter pullistercoris TaxID=2838418 RepID=A0A9D1YC21_9FIRM|nr:1-(5-phosphoribosyl)-5-[(5-phosphoribosylamino)methylideneamino]imidazole-4-carboxamide isomerase [Candidatus Acutalibacter pullistercoris]